MDPNVQLDQPATTDLSVPSPLINAISVATTNIDILGLISSMENKADQTLQILLQKAIANPAERLRVPNAVTFSDDVESKLDASFTNDLFHEADGTLGLFFATSRPGVFEFCPEASLAAEVGEVAARLLEIVRSADADKDALVLFRDEVAITEVQEGGRKTRKPYRLVKLNLSRSSVQRTGIPLSLATSEADKTEETAS